MEKIFLSIVNPEQVRKEIESEYVADYPEFDLQLSCPDESDEEQIKKARYQQKAEQETRWMTALAEATCEEIRKVLEREKPDKDKLYVFLLPEGWMHARNDSREKAERGEGVTDYKRPFVPEAVRSMLREDSAYCRLTREYPNLLLCPGTVWWKDIVWYEEEKKFREVYFQSAPVFWQGKCILFWDKQLMSGKDGAGEYNDANKGKWEKWMDYRKRILRTAGVAVEELIDEQMLIEAIEKYIAETHEPIKSTIGIEYSKLNKKNVFSLEWQGEKISFSIEICLDCAYKITEKLNEPKPDIQLVVSNSLGFCWDLTYMNECAFWCDFESGSYRFAKKAEIMAMEGERIIWKEI